MSNEWFERGELPPVGVECLFAVDSDDETPFHKELKVGATVKIIAHFKNHNNDVAAFTFVYGRQKNTQVEQALACCFRPIRTEREKAIEAALKAVYAGEDNWILNLLKNPSDVAGALYDAGLLRLPEDKK